MERFLPRLHMPLARIWTTSLFVLLSLVTFAQRPFITTWETAAANETVTIPVNSAISGYNYSVDWGDGNIESGQTGDATHTYATAGTYTVSINGSFPAIKLGEFGIEVSDKLVSIEQWGDIAWQSMEGAFSGARYMVVNATDAPNLSGAASLARMFDGAEAFNGDLSAWDVSGITDMSSMFYNAFAFNGNISNWDVSNVTDMRGMFWQAAAFNQDIGGWNVGNVADMSFMFYQAPRFNQDLSRWNVSSVTTMNSMFFIALDFDQSLGSWNISSVTDMDDMLLSTGLSSANYGATLIGWAALPTVPANITLDASGQEYCPGSTAETARQELEMKGWNIIGDNPATDCGIGPADPNHFITVWNTDINAGTGPYDIKIPATGEFTYTWVDISNPAVTGSGNGSGETFVTFPEPGTYEVRMAPTGGTPFHAINLHYLLVGNDASKLLEVKNWGTIHWSGFQFYGCRNLKITATDIPDLSGVTDLSFAFSGSGIDEIPNINDWDVSTVTDLSNMFEGVAGFNQSLDNWDVSKVTSMAFMFDGATSFNQPLDSWDVRKLEDISYMFRHASSFNQSLAAWQLESFVGGIGSFHMSNMSCENFSYSLYSWATNPNTNDGAILGGSGVTYSPDVAPYVDRLRDELNWTFQLLQEGTCSVVLPDSPIDPDANNILYVDINVDIGAPGYTGAGDSWENAIPELADALKWAREQHDGGNPGWTETEPLHIFVATGTYLPIYSAADGGYTADGGRDNAFVLVPDVQVYGGFDPSAGIETLEDTRILPSMDRPGEGSILSGDFAGNDNTDNFDNHTENAHHVTIVSGAVGSARMDGFTVTGGYAIGATSGVSVEGRTVYRYFGGGTYIITASPQLTHMVWFNNYGDWGGGLYNSVTLLTENSSPKLSNVTFYRNMAPGGGGGMRNYGGSPEIVQAIFSHNGAGLVEDATASGPGGGIYSHGNSSTLLLTNVTLFGNWIIGVVPVRNLNGGGIQIERSTAILNNVVMWANEVEGDPTAPSASISSLESNVTIANSLIAHSGGSDNWNGNIGTDGGNNLDLDPEFVSTMPGTAEYLQLSTNSPAINAGSNQGYNDAGGDPVNDLDLAGNPRVYNQAAGGVIDMGAYEYQGEPISTIVQLATLDAVQVAYGTALEEVEGVPTTVMATLSDDRDVTVPLNGNTDNWILLQPAGGSYDGNVAGTYVFAVPLVLPDEGDDPYFTNPDDLRAEVTIIVAKGTPVLTVSWNGETVDTDEGLSLTYGDVGELLLSTTDTDGVVTYALGNDDTPVLDLADLSAVAAQQAGMATLTLTQEETDNFEAASVEIIVTVAPKAITIVPTSDQGRVYGADEPTAYGYELEEGSTLAFDDELTDIVSEASREAGEDVGAYDIELAFGSDQTGNYAITFEADNNAFEITPLQIAVTATDKSKVFGSVDPALTYTFTPDLIGDDEFTGELDRETGEDVGMYAITQGTLLLGDNYEIGFEPGTLTITSAEYDGLEFNSGSFVYDGSEHMLEVTSELPEGTTVTYEIDGEAGNGATNVGTYEITAIIDGGTNYEDAELTATLMITPFKVTVRAADKTKVFGTDDPALTYTYTPALIGDDAYTGRLDREEGETVGSYAVTQGNLLLDDNYEIAFEPGTLTITPAEYDGLEFNSGSFVYDGSEHMLEVTGELPEGTTVTYEIDGEAGNGATNVGTYEITAIIDGGTNYEDAELTATLMITPFKVTVRAADKTKVFGTDDPALTYTYTPALIGDDAFTGRLDREEGETVGSYAVTQGNLLLDDNYEIAFEPGTLTITPAEYDGLEFNSGSFVYDGSEHMLEVTGELPEGTTVTYEIDGEAGNGATNVGTYEITAIIDGGTNYEDAELTATLMITPFKVTVRAADKTKVFGTDDPALTYTYTPALIGDDAFTGELDREEGVNVGTYAITQGTLLLSDNYEISFEPGTLTITPAVYEGIEFNNASFTYDGTEYALAITGELPTDATVAYEIDGEVGNGATDAGIYEITAIIDGGTNYEDAELTATLMITPLKVTVRAADKTKVFGTDDPELTYTYTPELIGDDAFAGELDREEGENVGTYGITQGDLSLNDNYGITFEGGALTITPADYEGVDFNDVSFLYDGTEHVLELTGELPEGATAAYEINGEPGNSATDAGTYEVTAQIDGGANYGDTELIATLTISQLEITVTGADKTKEFGSDDPALTYTFTPELIGDDAFTGELDREEGESVGDYAITQGDLSLGDNYGITFEAGTLTITSAEINGITFNNTSFTYDGTEHRLTLAGELPAGASVTYENNGRTNVGNQLVKAIIDGGGNYRDEVLEATLRVLPATRTLDFPALPEKTYGDAAFDAEAMTSSGEAVTYTSSNPEVAEVTADGAIFITGAGETTITATVPENANYSTRPQESRTLTVHKATQTITLDGPMEVNRDAGSVNLTASSTSGLPVVLTADNAAVATLEGATLHIHRLGTVTIKATQAGDANHEAAEPVTLTVRVVDPTSDLPVRVHPVISPNGDGINEFLMIEAIQDYPENRVTIFNRNGTLLWEASGYDNNRVAFRGMSTGQLLLAAGTYFYIVEVKDGDTWKHKKGYFVLRY